MKFPFCRPAILAAFVSLVCAGPALAGKTADIKILAINDFHGQITTGLRVAGRPVGGAAVLASYLEAELPAGEGRCFLVEAGDLVGASQPESALLQDEPAVTFVNYLSGKMPAVGAAGNHELDKGVAALKRLLDGDSAAGGATRQVRWRGAQFPVLCANMVDSASALPVLAPFVVMTVAAVNVQIAFIGVTLRETKSMACPGGLGGTVFLDEAKTVNYYVSMLRETRGIHAFVVLCHKGGRQPPCSGWTDTLRPIVSADILDLVSRFDDDVDVVCTAHAHEFTNALVRHGSGHATLVTQAYSKGTAYAEIECTLDSGSRDIRGQRANIVTTWGDAGPGLAPDPVVAAMVDSCTKKVLPLTGRVVGSAQAAISRMQNSAGESSMGDLIADAQRAALAADVAFMNPGGIRQDLAAGEITWGMLYNVQPFGNRLVKLSLTGQQLFDVLNQQWDYPQESKMLGISGIAYTWDGNLPVGSRVVEIRKNGKPVDRNARYSVAVNSFLAGGGDNFTALRRPEGVKNGPLDLDALVAYIKSLPQPFACPEKGRCMRRN